jgi:hypothetical protein
VFRKPTCLCDLFAGYNDVALLALRSHDDGNPRHADRDALTDRGCKALRI